MPELDPELIAARITAHFGQGVAIAGDKRLIIEPDRLDEVALFLRDDNEISLDYLNSITAIDRKTHFDLAYRLSSLIKGHSLDFKVSPSDRTKGIVPSVTAVWRGADLQEREIFDLFGIGFKGHPNLKRLFLWEGFPGYPLRKDWVSRDA